MEDLCSENILKMFETYDKVLEAVNSRRFISLLCKNFRFYVFKGLKRDYIVSPCRFCTCEDFTINYLSKSRETPCYHVVGFKIAEINNKLVEISVDVDTLVKIIEEIVFDGISITIRKILV